MEPRSILHSTVVLRQDSALAQERPSQWRYFPEPEIPIHPALEYEVYADDESSTTTDDNEESTMGNVDDVVRHHRKRRRRIKRMIKTVMASILLIVSGVGTVVAAKLQAIPMYHYPNFTNIFSLILYIPICFAYIIPASSSPSSTTNPTSANHPTPPTASSFATVPHTTDTASWCPRRSVLYKFALMGLLDSLATTLQTFAAVYVSDALLWAWLPAAAAVPVSYIVTYSSGRRKVLGMMHTVGSITVVVGISCIVVGNFLKRPSEYRCEAADLARDCPLCRVLHNEEDCVTAPSNDPTTDDGWMVLACRWVPYEEASKAEELLNLVWSVALIVSTVPLTISAMYKQKVVRRLGSTSPLLYVSGWIAVFQLGFSCIIAIPAGLLTTSSGVLKNLYHGGLCYAGHGTILSGCHPDIHCGQAAIWLNASVLSQVMYTLAIVMVLKYDDSSTCITLFLSLTVIVPLSHLVLGLMGAGNATTIAPNDLAGLVLILSGLILYRFALPAKTMGPPKRRRRLPNTPLEPLLEADAAEPATILTGDV